MHSFNLLKKAVIAAVALCSFTAASMVEAATWTITYPRPIDDSDARAQYPIALLKLALDKTGVNYELRPSDRILLTGKAMRQLRENREVNVVWSMTDSQREKELTIEISSIAVSAADGLAAEGDAVFAPARERAAPLVHSLTGAGPAPRGRPVGTPCTTTLSYHGRCRTPSWPCML